MPNNVYVLDLQVIGAELVTIYDDGAGEDAISVNGLYSQPVEISLCWTETAGVTSTAGAYYVDQGGLGHRLIVKGIVENAIGSNGCDAIRGNEFGNRLYGDHATIGPGDADTLWGGLGDDLIQGGIGSDLIEGEGDNDRLFGDAGNDTILGGTGIDTVDGGGGADNLNGGGTFGDQLTYALSRAGVQVSLKDGMATSGRGGDAEGDVILGFSHVIGSSFADRIVDMDSASLTSGANDQAFFGNGGRDKLFLGGGNDSGYGGSGDDYLSGGLGDDLLVGGEGRDILRGGPGQDMLTGGTAADRFIFITAAETATTRRDIITDFAAEQGDRIELGGIDARTDQIGNQPFTLISGDFSGQSGQLRLEQIGSDTLVQGDLNGDAMADFAILVQNALGLTALDFLL